MQQFRIRIIKIPRWQLILATAVLIALMAALFVLALGVFLIVLPFALVAAALAWFFGTRGRLTGGDDGHTIDGEYRVVDQQRRLDRDRDG